VCLAILFTADQNHTFLISTYASLITQSTDYRNHLYTNLVKSVTV